MSICRICREEPDNNVEEAVTRLLLVYALDPRVRILSYLSRLGEPASLRKIARNIGYTHKNTLKYLEDLEKAGLVEVVYRQSNLTLYTVTDTCMVFKNILSNRMFD